MKLFFQGHQEKYAIEQTMLMLFPGERPEYPDTAPGGNNELELSLSLGSVWCTSSAVLRWNGKTSRKQCRVRASLLSEEDPIAATRLRRRTLQRSFYLAAVELLNAEPSWGMLSGVRPVKLPTKAIEEGATRVQAEAMLRDLYHVSAPRRKLAMACADASLSVKHSLREDEISLYVGIPFCPTRCAYCSFISASGDANRLIPDYLELLLREIETAGAAAMDAGKSIRSVYIGGGTPTTLNSLQLSRLMESIRKSFHLKETTEFTVEAGRPDTITEDRMIAIRDGGGNRVSVNPQTMSDSILKTIGRSHRSDDILRAYEIVRKVDVGSVNMDLIAGLPGDSPAGFADTLQKVIDLKPENITVHTLALKRGARLRQEEISLPDGPTVDTMLTGAWSNLDENGYAPYYLYRQKFMSGSFENVGWCLPGTLSEYNICMMEELHTVLSLGAGGVTKQIENGCVHRLSNPKYPQEYLRSADTILENKRKFFLP